MDTKSQKENLLTPTQQQAVESNADATLVIAGPGTGKTHIIASRIQYLVEKQGVLPQRILCLTFTDAGAVAMKQRVVQFLGTQGYDITIGTFHSFASSLIQNNPDVFSYSPNLQAIDEIEKAQLIQAITDLMRRKRELRQLADNQYNQYTSYASAIRGALSQLKREGVLPHQFKKQVQKSRFEFAKIPTSQKMSTRGDRARKGLYKIQYEDQEKRIERNAELATIYEQYEQIIQRRDLYDFEDMINRASAGLRSSRQFLKHIQNRYTTILVDEYQDTNGSQNNLLFTLLNRPKNNVFIVGDDDQAIFRFQGASLDNFTEVKQAFKNLKIISLVDNFRSPQLLLNSALSVITNNDSRVTKQFNLPDKQLVAQGKTKNEKNVAVYELENETHEQAFLVRRIQEIHKKTGVWNGIAILTRSNREHAPLGAILDSYNIPYTLTSAKNVLKDPRINSLFTIINACVNPLDNVALSMFLLHPCSPIETKDAYVALAEHRKTRQPLYNILQNQKFLDILNVLTQEKQTLSGSQWIQKCAQETGFLDWTLKQQDKHTLIAYIRTILKESERRAELGVEDLLKHFTSFQELNLALEPIQEFRVQDAVYISTIHKSKGQEFDYVFMPNATDTNWEKSRGAHTLIHLPDTISPQSQDEQDQRRLFYVGLTRAKQQLTISLPAYSLKKDAEQVPSKFVVETNLPITQQQEQSKTIEQFLEKTTRPPARSLARHNEQEVIKTLIHDPKFALSATGINIFLECPCKFLYSRVLQAPEQKTSALVFGSAIHAALQQYFETPHNQRNEQNLVQFALSNIAHNSPLTQQDNREMSERAEQVLTQYFTKSLSKEPDPLSVEKGYSAGKLFFDDIPIVGKIDKISRINEDQVRVVDYKTGKAKTQNAILGKNKGSNKSSYQQLMFYKLLLELDTTFKHTPTKFTLDYVEHLQQVDVPIDAKDYQELQQTIRSVWRSITTLEFLQSTEQFPFCGECVYCKSL